MDLPEVVESWRMLAGEVAGTIMIDFDDKVVGQRTSWTVETSEVIEARSIDLGPVPAVTGAEGHPDKPPIEEPPGRPQTPPREPPEHPPKPPRIPPPGRPPGPPGEPPRQPPVPPRIPPSEEPPERTAG